MFATTICKSFGPNNATAMFQALLLMVLCIVDEEIPKLFPHSGLKSLF